MLKNVTITVEEDALKWARIRAAEKGTSVSKFVGQMLSDQMRRGSEYWEAYERFKALKPIPGFDASKRMTREETHERRR